MATKEKSGALPWAGQRRHGEIAEAVSILFTLPQGAYFSQSRTERVALGVPRLRRNATGLLPRSGLESTKGPVEVIVIDRAEKPSEN